MAREGLCVVGMFFSAVGVVAAVVWGVLKFLEAC